MASKDFFSKAFEQFKSGHDGPGSFLALSGMLDSVNIRFDSVFELDHLIPLTGELLAAYHHQFPSPEIESRVTASMLNALVLGQPGNPALDYWRNRGLALAEDVADMDTALRILLSLAFHRILSGEPEKVPLILDAFHKRVEAGRYAPLYVLLQRDVQAFYHYTVKLCTITSWHGATSFSITSPVPPSTRTWPSSSARQWLRLCWRRINI